MTIASWFLELLQDSWIQQHFQILTSRIFKYSKSINVLIAKSCLIWQKHFLLIISSIYPSVRQQKSGHLEILLVTIASWFLELLQDSWIQHHFTKYLLLASLNILKVSVFWCPKYCPTMTSLYFWTIRLYLRLIYRIIDDKL